MKLTHTPWTAIWVALAVLAAASCTQEPETGQPQEGTSEAQVDDEGPIDPSRIAVPPTVRSNLGITFVTVERRRVERTRRIPGQFEYLPSARREYRAMLPGRIELLVKQFERVEAGQPLFRVASPAWHELHRELFEAESTAEGRPSLVHTRLSPPPTRSTKRNSARVSRCWKAALGSSRSLARSGEGASRSLQKHAPH